MSSDLRQALIDFRQHVIDNATQWRSGAGSHHHPIWLQISEALEASEPAPMGVEELIDKLARKAAATLTGSGWFEGGKEMGVRSVVTETIREAFASLPLPVAPPAADIHEIASKGAWAAIERFEKRDGQWADVIHDAIATALRAERERGTARAAELGERLGTVEAERDALIARMEDDPELDRQIIADMNDQITRFATAILHGDDEHRAWLMEAADMWNRQQLVPPPRGTALAKGADMTDAETARDAWLRAAILSSREQQFAIIEAAITAARANERGKIVAWLRSGASAGGHIAAEWHRLDNLAGAIERGDHAPPAGGTNG